jgi:phage FluMu protein gp41
MHSGGVGVQIEQVVVVNNGHAEFAQPSLATEDVARQVWKFGEVNEAFKYKVACLDNYFMAESLYRATK